MIGKVTLFEFWKLKEAEWGRTVTIREVSEETGVNKDTIIDLRKNRLNRVDLKVAGKICKFFNVPAGPIPFIIYEPDD